MNCALERIVKEKIASAYNKIRCHGLLAKRRRELHVREQIPAKLLELVQELQNISETPLGMQCILEFMQENDLCKPMWQESDDIPF